MRFWIKFKVVAFASVVCLKGFSQVTPSPEQDFKNQLLYLESRVENIELNLGRAQEKFQTGIALATLGYAVTIAGGLMLGRENDRLGQRLLIAGGATGVAGTF